MHSHRDARSAAVIEADISRPVLCRRFDRNLSQATVVCVPPTDSKVDAITARCEVDPRWCPQGLTKGMRCAGFWSVIPRLPPQL